MGLHSSSDNSPENSAGMSHIFANSIFGNSKLKKNWPCTCLRRTASSFPEVRIGRRLAELNYAQLRAEADFRFSLLRVRENAEAYVFSNSKLERIFLSSQFNFFSNFF